MKYGLFSVALFSALAHASTPFLIFAGDAAYTDSATIPVAQKYLLPGDYLGYEAVARTPQLAGIVEATHRVAISATVEGLRKSIPRDCQATGPSILYYQLSDVSSLPPGQAIGIIQNIATVSTLITPGACQSMGLISEGSLFSSGACDGNLDSLLYQQVNWRNFAYLDITGDWLLSDACGGQSSIPNYLALMRSIAGAVRSQNPKILITAHLSFGSVKPEVTIAASRSLSGIVDGFLIAYPLSPEHQHLYCTASNLEMVFSALRPR